MSKFSTDTSRFKILKKIFWKHWLAQTGNPLYYGRWAYEIIKNSNNPYALSDGYDIKGALFLKEKNFDSAFFFFNKALILSKSVNYKVRMAWSYTNLGEVASTRGDSRSAINNFISAKKIFRSLKDNNFPEEKLNYEIAEDYINLNKYDSAIVFFQYNLESAKKNSDYKGEISASLGISNYYQKLNNIQKSSEYLSNALKIAETLKEKDPDILSTIYMKIGDSFLENKKNYSAARSYYNKALELIQNTDYKKKIAALYSSIGKTYLDENNNELAMVYNLKSLKISEEINYRHSISDSYLHLGYAYKKLGKDKLALESFTKCWQTQCDYCPPIKFHEALVGIGDIYLKQNNFSNALYWYNKSIILADSVKAKLETAKSKFRLGDYYNKINQKSQAESLYMQSLQTAKEVNDLSLIKSIADTFSNFYKSKNDFKSALNYLQLASAVNDSLAKAEQQASMANFEMNFEIEKMNKESEEKAFRSGEEIKRQRLYLYFLIVFSLMLTILGIVIYISYKRKKNDNILLTLQKQQIEEKNLEIQFQIDEIIEQKNEIEKISNQLHETDQMKLNFFANISHELRTPLTLIASPLTKLLKNVKDEELKDTYSLMYRNTRRLQNLIDRVLDVSRLDKGELKLNRRRNNLNKLIRVIAAMFQSISDEKNIEFSLIESNENIIFSFDADRMEQIVNNLLSNAFKFTPIGGKIKIYIELTGNPLIGSDSLINGQIVEIRISDTGVGIPPESIDKVFDRFYQTDSTLTRNFEGSGIGLALAKELVELHNGNITVKSEPGKGAEFVVHIPFITGDDVKDMEDVLSTETISKQFNDEIEEGYYITQKQMDTILLVEDNSDLRVYLKNSLNKDFNVLTACNGTEGIDSAKRNIPDIIISDVMMPGTDGYQLTKKLKENINTCHIPIILLTAKAGRESRMEGFEKGADDYIIKPFDEEELLLKVKNILQTRQRLQENYRKQLIVSPSEIEVKSLDEQFLFNLTKIIEHEISNPGLDVDLLCSSIGLSRPQLYRKLKALTGLSINHFIRSIRLKRAAQLLEKKASTVSEIAYMTGFENLSYFTKKFKEEFGKLPSEY